MEDALGEEGAPVCKAGTEIDADIAAQLYESREKVGQIEITALSESKKIVVTNDDTSRDYILPKGAEILVDEDQEVTAGTKLIHSSAP